MSEPQKSDIQAIIAAAIAGAGKVDRGWKSRVNEAIPFVAAAMGEGSRQWKIAEQMLEAQLFNAVYLGYEMEETSKRCLVQLKTTPSKRYPEGVEPIRSHRTDNPAGEAMRRRLDSLQEGDEILVWKAMEDAGDNKVRVLAHFEFKWRGDKDAEKPAGRTPTDQATSAEPAGSGAHTGPAGDFESLPSKVKVKVVKRLRAEGIEFPTPQPDQADRFAEIIREET